MIHLLKTILMKKQDELVFKEGTDAKVRKQ